MWRRGFGFVRRRLVGDVSELKACTDDIGVPDIPTGRSDICTILVTAEDKSSFNIFMIAGVGKTVSFHLI